MKKFFGSKVFAVLFAFMLIASSLLGQANCTLMARYMVDSVSRYSAWNCNGHLSWVLSQYQNGQWVPVYEEQIN